jgi:hypothetical protein
MDSWEDNGEAETVRGMKLHPKPSNVAFEFILDLRRKREGVARLIGSEAKSDSRRSCLTLGSLDVGRSNPEESMDCGARD